MNFIKRALNYIKNKKLNIILQILIFSVTFSFALSGLIIFCSADSYVKNLETSVKNCVTVSYISLIYNQSGAVIGNTIPIDMSNIENLLDFDEIHSYNYSFFDFVKFEDGAYETIEPETEQASIYNNDATIYSTINSEYDSAFTTNGYYLIEGRHITQDEENNDICMISNAFANLNSLSIGDTVQVSSSYGNDEYEFEIIGIFETPDGDYKIGFGDSPDELIIIPSANEQIVQSSIFTLSVYLNEESDISGYVNYLEENFNIRKTSYDRYDYSVAEIPEEAIDFNFSELVDYYTINEYMDIYVDTQWYDMVAKPLEKVRDLSQYLAVAFAISAFLIILLFCIDGIRNRQKEFGILLAIGESKFKIILQICSETFFVVGISAVIGLVVGIYISSPIIQNYTNSAYYSQATIDNQVNAISSSDYSTYEQGGVGDNDVAYIDLIFKTACKTTVAPNISANYSPLSLMIYLSMVLLVTIFMIFGQMFYITRLKPAKLLIRRK